MYTYMFSNHKLNLNRARPVSNRYWLSTSDAYSVNVFMRIRVQHAGVYKYTYTHTRVAVRFESDLY